MTDMTIITCQEPDDSWTIDVVVNPPQFVYHAEADDKGEAYRRVIHIMSEDLRALIPGYYAEFVAGTSYDY
jgi:hypothetical protein